MSDDAGQKRRVIRQTTVYDKRRPEGRQAVAFLYAHGDAVYFGCQQAGVEGKDETVSFLNKQHAVEFASCLLMMALGLPGPIPDGDVSFGAEQFSEQDDEGQTK